jgi:excisionase family DNA binding protein
MNTPQNLNAELKRFFNVGETARYCGVSERHIYRLADAGRMPQSIKLGASRRWDRVALDAWIAAGCPATPPTRQGGSKRCH